MESSPPFAPVAPPVLPDDDAALTRLHPNFVWALRVQMLLTFVPLVVAALALEFALPHLAEAEAEFAVLALLPQGLLAAAVMLLALVLLTFVPMRRYQARGYHMSSDRLRVVRGILWHSDIVVPFGRVQHIDLHQGPIERFFGIATLTLHTAGNHNASVDLPGLGADLARMMREDIRSHIKRESL